MIWARLMRKKCNNLTVKRGREWERWSSATGMSTYEGRALHLNKIYKYLPVNMDTNSCLRAQGVLIPGKGGHSTKGSNQQVAFPLGYGFWSL